VAGGSGPTRELVAADDEGTLLGKKYCSRSFRIDDLLLLEWAATTYYLRRDLS
jgi:hypothetical protein